MNQINSINTYMFFIDDVTNQHIISSFKQHMYYFPISVGQKSSWTWLGFLLRVSQGWTQGLDWVAFLTGGSGEESTSKLIQVIGCI